MLEIPVWAMQLLGGSGARPVHLDTPTAEKITAQQAADLLREATAGWATFQSEVCWLGVGAPGPSPGAGDLLEADLTTPQGGGWIRRRDGALHLTLVHEVTSGGEPCLAVATPVLAQDREGAPGRTLDYVTYWREATTPADTRQLVPWFSVLAGSSPAGKD